MFITQSFIDIFDKLGIILFPINSMNNIEEICMMCDGVVITGTANNIDPKYYNEKPSHGQTYEIDEFSLDKKIIETFAKYNKNILGICGGLQSINVVFGGSLYQKVENHNLKTKNHKIEIKEKTVLEEIYSNKITNIERKIEVNSFHCQAIKDVASNFKISAVSEDGIIEAIEYKNIIAVQWHPEKMNDINLFSAYLSKFNKEEKI